MKKIVLLLLAVVAFGVAWVVATRQSVPATSQTGSTNSQATEFSEKHDASGTLAGVESLKEFSASPVPAASSGAETNKAKASGSKQTMDNPNDYGITQPVRADLNPQVASVSEALRGKKNPERLSPLIQPKPFDPEAYKKDSAAYLNVVEPGRCFQSKNPGKDVPKIQSLSPQFQQVAQGQSVSLRVQAQAKFPVTFTSFDMGKFQNELTSITVEANESGIAETKFYGAAGTIEEVKILASSPMTSGQIQFLVNVTK